MDKRQRDDSHIFAITLAGYILLLPVIYFVARSAGRQSWVPLLGVIPLIPGGLALFAAVRFTRVLNPQQRAILLEGLIFGFGASGLVGLVIGFLQNAGLPSLSWIWVLPVLAIFWLIGLFLASRGVF
ncbi:MAG: hypothetical protein M1396_04675 [Chloroflexi bacterium]|nr:hypothetical protein [Chloroflexota bacterium]